MQQMIGVTMGPGWRQAIERALGGVRGCTHLRELLFNMATAAYQTIPAYRHRLRRHARLISRLREFDSYIERARRSRIEKKFVRSIFIDGCGPRPP